MADRPRPHATIDALRPDLTAFVDDYNTRRPHRALQRRPPAAAFTATPAARPADRPFPSRVIVGRLKVTAVAGVIAATSYAHIGLGNAWTGHRVTAICDGDLVTVLDGHRFLRATTLQPGRRNYPADDDYRTRPKPAQTIMTVSDVPTHTCQRCPRDHNPTRRPRDVALWVAAWV